MHGKTIYVVGSVENVETVASKIKEMGLDLIVEKIDFDGLPELAKHGLKSLPKMQLLNPRKK